MSENAVTERWFALKATEGLARMLKSQVTCSEVAKLQSIGGQGDTFEA